MTSWKEKLTKEISRFRSEIDQISTEILEIDRAMTELARRGESLRQARRLAEEHLDRLAAIHQDVDSPRPTTSTPDAEPAVPSGPPVSELVLRILSDAGPEGMKVAHLLRAIAARRPEIQVNSVSSVLSKLKRNGKIVSINGQYKMQQPLGMRL